LKGGPGIPATVPNLVDGSLATVSNAVTGGIVERTSKGGLHVAPPKSASGNLSLTVAHPDVRNALLAAFEAGHQVFMGEVYRITRNASAGFAPTSATARFMGLVTPSSADWGSLRVNSVLAVRGYPTADVVGEQAGTTLVTTGQQAALTTMVHTPALAPGTSNSMLVHHNGGAASPMPNRITYLSIIEDLTVSGRTHAEVAALVNAWVATEFGTGGRYAGDTWTTPVA
jgi:hypothetical protein